MGEPHKATKSGFGSLLAGGSLYSLAGLSPAIDDELVWTTERSTVPPQLAGRIPAEAWAATFDAVRSRRAEELDFERMTLQSFASNPPVCCMPCAIFSEQKSGEVQREAHENELAWLALVQSEQAKYRAYGGACDV